MGNNTAWHSTDAHHDLEKVAPRRELLNEIEMEMKINSQIVMENVA